MNIKYKTQDVKIIVQDNLMTNLYDYINPNKKYFLVTDDNVHRLYSSIILQLTNIQTYILPPGEASKNMQNSNAIIKELLEHNYTKDDYLIAFGGGVIGDLTGFVAGIYKRGINYINIPTTLISQVDSSIGGKVAVNFEGFKNQVGLIYHPELILIDPILLKTLPEEEYLSGMGEVVKYAALFSEEMFIKLETKDYQLIEIIRKCLELKVKLTLVDEFDKGERQLLNFGHTIGHAIEAKYHMLHGIAIGYGMYLESKNLRLKQLLESLGFDFSKDFVDLETYIKQDKKIRNGKITKVKLIKIGEARLEEGEIDEYFYE